MAKAADPWARHKTTAQKYAGQLFPAMEHNNRDAFDARVEIMANLLASGVKPGAEGAAVEMDGAYHGEWHIIDDGVDEYVAIRTKRQVMTRITKAVTGARMKNVRGKLFAVCAMQQAPQAIAEIDALPLALAMQLALLVDTRTKPVVASVQMLASAKTVDDIPDRALREETRELIKTIPMAKGFAPRPFQAVGIAFARMTGYRAYIADMMGLGKTLQAIACLSLDHKRLIPALIVAPTSVLRNWEAEFKKFAPWFRIHIIKSSNDRVPPPDNRTVYIVSYGLLDSVLETLMMSDLQTAIFDEAQMLKNPEARRSVAARQLAHYVPHVLLLSGTPMENKIDDLWHQLHMLDPEEFPTLDAFKEQYVGDTACVVRQSRKGCKVERAFVVPGSNGIDALTIKMRSYMVRRLKKDVAKELPEKTRVMAWADLPPAARIAYDRVEKDLPNWIRGQFKKRMVAKAAVAYVGAYRDGMTPGDAAQFAVDEVNATAPPASEIAQLAMVRLGYMRRMVGEAKSAAAVQWIKAFAPTPERPLVVFIEHQKPLHTIGKALTAMGLSWTFIDGSVSADARGDRANDFQAGKYAVIVGSRAMYAGVNLWRAADMLFVERWWIPAAEEQAEDRCHRIGQVNPVQITYLMAVNTVDTHIATLVDAKRELVASVMGSEAVTDRASRSAASTGALSQSVSAAMVAQVSKRLAAGGSFSRVTIRDLHGYLVAQRS